MEEWTTLVKFEIGREAVKRRDDVEAGKVTREVSGSIMKIVNKCRFCWGGFWGGLRKKYFH